MGTSVERPLYFSDITLFSGTLKSRCLGTVDGAVVGSMGVLLLPPLAGSLLVSSSEGNFWELARGPRNAT